MARRVWDDNPLFYQKVGGTGEQKFPDPVANRPCGFAVVGDFIDHLGPSWKEDSVWACFSADDSEKILLIPLSSRRPTDRIIWTGTTSGKYSVKSAYHLAVTSFSSCATHLSSASTTDPFWKKIWHSHVPPKIRHFLWSACSNSLATNLNLCQRGIVVDPICSLCGEGRESVSHILVEYSCARQSWRLSPIRFDLLLHGQSSFRLIYGELLEQTQTKGVELFAFIAWNLWHARNSRVFEDKTPHPPEIVQRSIRQQGEAHLSAL